MRLIIPTLLALSSFLLAGCTNNSAARSYGGHSSLELPEGVQLITLTWKGDSLWVLYFDPKDKSCTFTEKSSFGLMQGSITIPNCDPLRVTLSQGRNQP
jgi:hypothetical protein